MIAALVLAMLGQVAEPVTIRIDPKAEQLLTAAEVVAIATADQAEQPNQAARYVHVPEWFTPGESRGVVDFILNSTLSRTSNLVQSTSLAGGRVVRVELDRLAVRDEDLVELVGLWELLAARESFYHLPAAAIAAAKPLEVLLTDGKYGPAKMITAGPKTSLVEIAGKRHNVPTVNCRGGHRVSLAPIAGLTELAAELGTNCPLVRFDELVALGFSSVNGGLYYQWAGISGDLKATVERFAGKDTAAKLIKEISTTRAGRLDPALAQSRALVITSGVTGRQRLVQTMFGGNGQPSVGPQLVAITLDVAEDNLDPAADPLRNLRDYRKYDGGEAIFSLPNGLLAYVVFDAADKIIDAVPDKVAHDFTARDVRSNAATTRVFSGVTCVHCHDVAETNWGWQPVKNDAALLVSQLGGPVDELGARDRRRALQELASQYAAADLESVFNLSRLPYQRQTNALTGAKTSRQIARALGDVYFGYWYDRVTAATAARDLGVNLPNPKAVELLLKIPPAAGLETLVEDAVLLRIKEGQHVTPVQWRTVAALVRSRFQSER